jgi:23S rRNA pseudouridine2605 synthase
VPLVRALSKLGVLSRRQAIDAVLAGRVTVGGSVVHDPGRLVSPERDQLAVDRVAAHRSPPRILALHKPRGYVTTRSDPQGRPTVYDLLPPDAAGLRAVGRLDLATSGLLLFTNDTQLAHRLTDPALAVPRTYLLTVRGALSDEDASRAVTHGVDDEGERLQPTSLVIRKRSTRETHLTVELTEGRNRELRRLFAALGHEVTRLKRIAFGPVALGDLPVGQVREVPIGVFAQETGGWEL